MTDQVEASVYLVMEGRRAKYMPRDEVTGLRPVQSAAVVASRQTYPTRLSADQVVVRVRLALPANIFDPLVPSAVVNVPEDMVRRGDIVVEATELPGSLE